MSTAERRRYQLCDRAIIAFPAKHSATQLTVRAASFGGSLHPVAGLDVPARRG